MATINLKCDGCGVQFEKEKKEHNRRIKKGYSRFFCNYTCAGKGLDRPNKVHVPVTVKCLWCNSMVETTTNPKGKRCCSRTCSAKYSQSTAKETHRSDKFKKKMSAQTKLAWKNGVFKLINSGKRRYNSKGEIELREYLKECLPNYEFTTGMVAKGINPDIWARKYKVIIEYDGIWHFKDIMGQLQDKQNKDRLTEQWCIDNGWRCIRIKEDLYKKNSSHWQQMIKQEVLNGTGSVVKFYA